MVFLLVVLFLMLSACGPSRVTKDSQANDNPQANVKKEPVTLSVFIGVPGMTDDEFKLYFTDPVQKIHPNISFELIRPQPGQNLNDLIVAGQIPDLLYVGPAMRNTVDAQVPLDLREPLKKHNIDISKIYPGLMDSIKQFGDNGEIYALPFTQNAFALWYNKDIFNKFGAPYPTDGMSWDQAIELAKKVSRTVDGVNYLGLFVTHGGITTFASPLSIDFIDPKTEQALVPDIWKSVFAKAMEIYDIPNNHPQKVGLNALDTFTKDQNVAMTSYWTNGMFSYLPNAKGLDWDVVQLPSFPEAPNKYLQADYHQFIVSRTSKQIEDAMEVLKVAISPEVQTISNRNGKLTVLNDSSILDQFAADLEFVKGKNIKGIFKSQPSKLIAQTDYNPAVGNAIRQAFVKVFDGKTDINTALREAKDQADQKVDELKQAKN